MPDTRETLGERRSRSSVPAGSMVSAAVAMAGVERVPPIGHGRAARAACAAWGSVSNAA